MKSLEELRAEEVLAAYEEKFGKCVPRGPGGIWFKDYADLMERVQHAIDTNTPFPPPKYKKGCVY